MGKIEKIILGCILGSIPTALFVYFVYSMIWGPTLKQAIIEGDLSEHVNGVVDSLYNDDHNHHVMTAILKNNDVFEIPPEWESDIETGDSLYKKKGTFFLEVYKKHGKKIVLDYRSTIRKD